MKTPAYIFDTDVFHKRIRDVQSALKDIPLVYSIKANPFLIPYIPEEIKHLEVCSPGELALCRELKVPGERIIYSGVMKEAWDIDEALSYGVDIITAESIRHYELIKEAAVRRGQKTEILPRLSAGNQFGMSEDDLLRVVKDAASCGLLHIKGVHYYSGTAKGMKQIEKDLARLEAALVRLKEEGGFECGLLEYGPGLASECFAGSEELCEKKDHELLDAVAPLIEGLNEKYPLSIEMGRFLTTSCGIYETAVMDIKSTEGVSYLIVDGGMHHIKYYGQNMAMKVPVIEHEGMGDPAEYTVCGSLCTTADVLARNVSLRGVRAGDVLRFRRAGAYAVTEASVLFLSRRMPEIYAQSEKDGLVQLRGPAESYGINKPLT